MLDNSLQITLGIAKTENKQKLFTLDGQRRYILSGGGGDDLKH